MAEESRQDIECARQGDRGAFGRLVQRYQRRVFATAFRMTGSHEDAADVAQEAFIRAFRGMSSFDGRSEFFTWLYRIVVNVALNHRRRARRTAADSLDEVTLPEPLQQRAAGDPARELELRRLVVVVRGAVEALPEALRLAVMLVLLDGLTYRAAAEVLECSEGTLGWRVHEARKRLREQLGADPLVAQYLPELVLGGEGAAGGAREAAGGGAVGK